MSNAGPLPTVQRHPFVGALAGLVLGAALALWLVLYGVVALGTWPPVLIPLIGGAAGVAWGIWGPIRGGGATPEAQVPIFNERVQEALKQNESVIRGASDEPPPERPLLPGIGPPSAGDPGDWGGPKPDRPDPDDQG
jgi:hypothetical protein